MTLNVAVVGAGVIGLSTAAQILETVPDVNVTVVADAFTPFVTSSVAAGFWYLYSTGTTPEDLLRRWGTKTFDHLKNILESSDAGKAGVQMVSGYQVMTEDKPKPLCHDQYFDFRYMSEKELKRFPGCVQGWAYTTVLAEGDRYLPYLMNRVRKNGGRFYQRKINDLQDLYSEYDTVVNCCGVFTNELFKDEHLQPARGQIIRVYAPWVKHFLLYDGGDTLIIPGIERVTLGGTYQVGNWNKEVAVNDRNKIWNSCVQLIPSLKTARHIEELVGLRPSRTTVRLEKEEIKYKDKDILVVHNYGHGGAGVTLHWGCAIDAAGFIKDYRRNRPKSRL